MLVGSRLLSYVTLLACSCLLLRFLQLSVAPLKRHQQAWGMCYSGFNRIRWVHVHAIKKRICVKNESGFRQTRLRVHGALGDGLHHHKLKLEDQQVDSGKSNSEETQNCTHTHAHTHTRTHTNIHTT